MSYNNHMIWQQGGRPAANPPYLYGPTKFDDSIHHPAPHRMCNPYPMSHTRPKVLSLSLPGENGHSATVGSVMGETGESELSNIGANEDTEQEFVDGDSEYSDQGQQSSHIVCPPGMGPNIGQIPAEDSEPITSTSEIRLADDCSHSDSIGSLMSNNNPVTGNEIDLHEPLIEHIPRSTQPAAATTQLKIIKLDPPTIVDMGSMDPTFQGWRPPPFIPIPGMDPMPPYDTLPPGDPILPPAFLGMGGWPPPYRAIPPRPSGTFEESKSGIPPIPMHNPEIMSKEIPSILDSKGVFMNEGFGDSVKPQFPMHPTRVNNLTDGDMQYRQSNSTTPLPPTMPIYHPPYSKPYALSDYKPGPSLQGWASTSTSIPSAPPLNRPVTNTGFVGRGFAPGIPQGMTHLPTAQHPGFPGVPVASFDAANPSNYSASKLKSSSAGEKLSTLIRAMSQLTSTYINLFKWYYFDLQNQCQGAYNTLVMLKWFNAGHFPWYTNIKRQDEAAFSPIGDGQRLIDAAKVILSKAAGSTSPFIQTSEAVATIQKPEIRYDTTASSVSKIVGLSVANQYASGSAVKQFPVSPNVFGISIWNDKSSDQYFKQKIEASMIANKKDKENLKSDTSLRPSKLESIAPWRSSNA